MDTPKDLGECLRHRPGSYSGYYELGNSYFWIAAHCDFVMEFIRPLIGPKGGQKQIKMLDAGCGYGSLLSRLETYGLTVGLDVTREACLFCQKEYGARVTQAALENSPFANNTFDFIFAIETLEHIKDDVRALKELHRILKQKGILVITLPAFMCLWGYHDKKYGHVLRYTKSRLYKIAEQSGFTVKESHYFKFFLFLPLFVLRKIKQIFTDEKDDFYKISPVINNLLHKLLNLEIYITRLFELPVGSNLFAILYKE